MSDFSEFVQNELAQRTSIDAAAADIATGSLLAKVANTFSKDYDALAQGNAGQILVSAGASAVPTWNDNLIADHDTSATGAELDTLTDNSIADALHRHSELVASDGSPDPALSIDASGNFDFQAGNISNIGTITSGNITISSPTPILVFKDSNSPGAASVGYIEWQDSGGGRAGFLGNNSSGNDDLYWKNEQGGNIGIETTGTGELQIFANIDMGGYDIGNVSNVHIDSNASGKSAITYNISSLLLTAAAMNATAKYTPAIQFGSTDPSFTTQNPKHLAAVIGRATEGYVADNDGGMAIDFGTTPNNPGTTSVPTIHTTITENGNLQLRNDAQLLQFGDAQDYSIQWDGTNAVHTVASGIFEFTSGISVRNPGQNTAPRGENLVDNGTFDSDLSDWTVGANWNWEAGGTAEHTSGEVETLLQGISVIDGETYFVEFVISGRTVGLITLTFGGMTGSLTKGVNARYRFSFIAIATENADLTFTPSTDFDGKIDDIVVQQITGTSDSTILLENSGGTDTCEIRAPGGSNLFVGLQAGQYVTTANYNTAFGKWALRALTTGDRNTAFGLYALQENTTGEQNTALGEDAMMRNVSGAENLAVGKSAMYSNVDGNHNTVLGKDALYHNISGKYNVAIARYALHQSLGDTNFAFGSYALYELESGEGNIALGYDSGRGIVTGDFNTIIGSNVIGLAADLTGYVIIADGSGNKRIVVDGDGNHYYGDGGVTNYTSISVTGDISQAGTARRAWTKYTANSVTLSIGSTSDVVADLQTAHDGNLYHIDEANGVAPAITLIIDFVSVTAFNWVNILAEYDGGGDHAVCIELYNWDTSSWNAFDAQDGIESAITNHDFTVSDDTNYIGTGGDAGKVRIRFNHPINGNGTHDLDIDVVCLYQ